MATDTAEPGELLSFVKLLRDETKALVGREVKALEAQYGIHIGNAVGDSFKRFEKNLEAKVLETEEKVYRKFSGQLETLIKQIEQRVEAKFVSHVETVVKALSHAEAVMKSMPIPEIKVMVPEHKGPDVHVNVPQLKAPDVHVNVPKQEPSIVNVSVPEQKQPDIHVNVPEHKQPDVHVNVPKARKTQKSILYDAENRPVVITEEEVE
jgi:hypothetical protein